MKIKASYRHEPKTKLHIVKRCKKFKVTQDQYMEALIKVDQEYKDLIEKYL